MAIFALEQGEWGRAVRAVQEMRAGPWSTRALATTGALFCAMGLRLALSPWLGDQVPAMFAFPAVALVSFVCGWRWAMGLAIATLLWLSIPWLPPSWSSATTGARLAVVAGLAGCAALGAFTKFAASSAAVSQFNTPAQRGLRYAMVVAAGLPIIVYFALAWTSFQSAMQRAQTQAEATLLMADAHVSGMIQANAIIGRHLQARLATLAAELRSPRELRRELAAIAQGLPQVNSLWVLGSDGYPLASSLFDPPPRINYADREYFRFHESASAGPYVSRLLRTRSTNEPFFDFSIRWEGRDGSFHGVINVTLKPEYLTVFFERLTATNPALEIALVRSDGYLIARWPGAVDVGDRVASESSIARGLAEGGAAGVVRLSSDEITSGKDLLLARVGGVPLAVAVTLDRDRVLASWRRDVAGEGALLLLCAVGVLGALAIALERVNSELVVSRQLAAESEERRKAEESLRQSRRLDALGTLTGGVAHDFNNLLGVIGNSLELLRRRDGNSAYQADTARMQRAVDSGVQLTRKLLAFSRTQALAPGRVDPGDLVSGAGELMRLAMGRDVSLEVHVEPGLPAIEIDRSEFEAALLNLAANARHASARSVRVTARAVSWEELPPHLPGDRAHSWMEIAVRDDGEGMSETVRDKAFEPFFTTRERGVGSGLGLSQVFGMCAQVGGAAWIESQPGEGATIHLVFPAAGRAR